MKSVILCCLAVCLGGVVALGGLAYPEDTSFPKVSVQALSEEPLTLLGRPTVVILAFHPNQQKTAEQWLNGLSRLKEDEPIRAIELAVMDRGYQRSQSIITAFMKKSASKQYHPQIAPLFTPLKPFTQSLGIAKTNTVVVLRLDAAGRIQAKAVGAFNQSALAQLMKG